MLVDAAARVDPCWKPTDTRRHYEARQNPTTAILDGIRRSGHRLWYKLAGLERLFMEGTPGGWGQIPNIVLGKREASDRFLKFVT
jgi:hypothetical protein